MFVGDEGHVVSVCLPSSYPEIPLCGSFARSATKRVIHLARLGPGQATRTVLDHMGVFVLRSAHDRLAILGARSAAGSLWHAISGAAARG
ncbi:hypothetical protein [Yoonia sp.]|uniref:hypothetical protein n=1 Tax=Yoonia sp. TaxID=2212373 RepID=UPI0025D1A16F|nr:hypothetical protein [Yoonia sp.]